MYTEELSKSEAREFLINYHNLNESLQLKGEEGVLQYFKRVGSIQYDPLNVVGRNADLVLQSKVKEYRASMLQNLLYRDNLLVDGFDKEMCIYNTEEYGRFANIRIANTDTMKQTLCYRNQLEALDIVDEVIDYIGKNGPIGSKDISIGESRESRWGHKKLSSAALDYLYTCGVLCVKNKVGTQKVYDFTDHVIGAVAHENSIFCKESEFLNWYVKRRIGSVGLLWEKRGGGWQGHYLSDKETRERTLADLLEQGHIKRFLIEDIKVPFYIRSEDCSFLNVNTNEKKVKFLAPLDNLLWDREMVSQLFQFHYRWEVYTPVIKRIYGYYVLPVLYGDKFIGRFEPDKAVKNTPLTVKNWWWEPEIDITDELLTAIEVAFKEFCGYLDIPYEWDCIRKVILKYP